MSNSLTGRFQRVLFKGILSREILIPSGVLQGSHLGPLLFALFVNDIPDCVNFAHVLLYAEDVKLFFCFSSIDDSRFLQGDLEQLYRWCLSNGMSLNLTKCKKLSFSRTTLIPTQYYINNYELENVSSFRDLGVIFDPKLRFHLHIESTVNKAKSILGFVKRWSKEFQDHYIAKRLYMSLVRLILEYSSVVWIPTYNCYIDIIESVQKYFLLFALRGLGWDVNLPLPPYESRLKLINLPTLLKRREMLAVIFMVKLIQGEISSPILLQGISLNVPARLTTHYVPTKLPQCRTNYELNNPLRLLSKLYNDHYHLFDPSVNSLNYIRGAVLSQQLPERFAICEYTHFWGMSHGWSAVLSELCVYVMNFFTAFELMKVHILLILYIHISTQFYIIT